MYSLRLPSATASASSSSTPLEVAKRAAAARKLLLGDAPFKVKDRVLPNHDQIAGGLQTTARASVFRHPFAFPQSLVLVARKSCKHSSPEKRLLVEQTEDVYRSAHVERGLEKAYEPRSTNPITK